MDVLRWDKQVTLAISKLCKGLTYEDKEDLKQDCFVALIEASDYLDRVMEAGEITPGGAAYTICYNKIVELRRLTPGTKVLEAAVSIEELSYDEKNDEAFIRGLFSGSPTEQGLDAAVESLPKTENYIIRCLYFKGMTEREVAKSVNKSRHWVRVEKAKAVDILRRYFEKG